MLNVRVSTPARQQLNALAVTTGLPLSEVTRRLLQIGLGVALADPTRLVPRPTREQLQAALRPAPATEETPPR